MKNEHIWIVLAFCLGVATGNRGSAPDVEAQKPGNLLKNPDNKFLSIVPRVVPEVLIYDPGKDDIANILCPTVISEDRPQERPMALFAGWPIFEAAAACRYSMQDLVLSVANQGSRQSDPLKIVAPHAGDSEFYGLTREGPLSAVFYNAAQNEVYKMLCSRVVDWVSNNQETPAMATPGGGEMMIAATACAERVSGVSQPESRSLPQGLVPN